MRDLIAYAFTSLFLIAALVLGNRALASEWIPINDTYTIHNLVGATFNFRVVTLVGPKGTGTYVFDCTTAKFKPVAFLSLGDPAKDERLTDLPWQGFAYGSPMRTVFEKACGVRS